MEMNVLNAIDYNATIPHIYSFLHIYYELVPTHPKILEKIDFFASIAVFDYKIT